MDIPLPTDASGSWNKAAVTVGPRMCPPAPGCQDAGSVFSIAEEGTLCSERTMFVYVSALS